MRFRLYSRNRGADDSNLPRVTQGRRAREDVVSAGERRFEE
jgi:hypothetical protein